MEALHRGGVARDTRMGSAGMTNGWSIEPGQLIAALSTLTIAVFLTAGLATGRRYAWLRRAAIVLYIAALALVLALVAAWLFG